MSDIERSDADDDVINTGEEEGGAVGADTFTPQAEVAGNDPAGFEVSGAGDKGGEGVGNKPSGGVGDWDPANEGGGGGEVY